MSSNMHVLCPRCEQNFAKTTTHPTDLYTVHPRVRNFVSLHSPLASFHTKDIHPNVGLFLLLSSINVQVTSLSGSLLPSCFVLWGHMMILVHNSFYLNCDYVPASVINCSVKHSTVSNWPNSVMLVCVSLTLLAFSFGFWFWFGLWGQVVLLIAWPSAAFEQGQLNLVDLIWYGFWVLVIIVFWAWIPLELDNLEYLWY
jgi:hypothetical protein